MRDTQWTEWDYALLDAHSAITMMRSPLSNQLRNLTEDPDVYWEIEASVDFAAKTLVEDRKDKPDEPGVVFYPTSPTKNGPFWTFEEWLEYQERDDRALERGAPEGGHAPGVTDLQAIQERRRRMAGDDG